MKLLFTFVAFPFVVFSQWTRRETDDDYLARGNAHVLVPRHAVGHTRIHDAFGSCEDSSDPNCVWYHLRMKRTLSHHRRHNPSFYRYLRKRFYLVMQTKKNLDLMKATLRHLLYLHNQKSIKLSASDIRNQKTIAYLDQLLRVHYRERNKQQRMACYQMTAQFLHDVEVMLDRMHSKNVSYRNTLHRWLRMSKRQHQRMFKIILAAQRRDMRRLLHIKSLQVWYRKKLHRLDVQTQTALRKIMLAFKGQEEKFQRALWVRLDQLQQSNDLWMKHEAAYKRVLLNLSRKQKLLLHTTLHQAKKITNLTILLNKQNQLLKVKVKNPRIKRIKKFKIMAKRRRRPMILKKSKRSRRVIKRAQKKSLIKKNIFQTQKTIERAMKILRERLRMPLTGKPIPYRQTQKKRRAILPESVSITNKTPHHIVVEERSGNCHRPHRSFVIKTVKGKNKALDNYPGGEFSNSVFMNEFPNSPTISDTVDNF